MSSALFPELRRTLDSVRALAAQRDEFVQKYNDEVKDRNNVVSNYNALAAEVKKTQNR